MDQIINIILITYTFVNTMIEYNEKLYHYIYKPKPAKL